MLIKNKNLLFFFAALLPGICTPKSKTKRASGQVVHKAAFPYLKYRYGAPFSGDLNRLNTLAWHPSENVFAVAGGPRNGVLPELTLYEVNSNGAGSSFETMMELTLGGNIQINTACWSPNGNYFALGGSNVSGDQLRVYSYQNSSLTGLVNKTWGSTGSAAVKSVSWHPSGNYLAVAGANQVDGYEVIIYAFTPSAATILTPVAQLDLGVGVTVYSASWNPSGNLLALGCGGTPVAKAGLQVYSFNTSSYALSNVSTVDFGGSTAYVKSVAWSCNGSYLAAGGYSITNKNQAKVYRVSSTGDLTLLSSAVVNFGSNLAGAFVNTVSWDPQGSYLIVGGYAPLDLNEFTMYAFDVTMLTPKIGARNSFGSNSANYVSAISWSPNRKYVLVGGYLPANSKEIWLMEFVTNSAAARV